MLTFAEDRQEAKCKIASSPTDLKLPATTQTYRYQTDALIGLNGFYSLYKLPSTKTNYPVLVAHICVNFRSPVGMTVQSEL